MQENTVPMPTFTAQQIDRAWACESHLRLRAHHKIPVPDTAVLTAMQAGVNAVAEYAAQHGLPPLPRWHEMDAMRYRDTLEIVAAFFACKCDFDRNDPLAVVFRTTMLLAAVPLILESNKDRRRIDRRVHRKQAERRETTINVRAYNILQKHYEHGIGIGRLAQLLYDLPSPASPRTKFYSRTQGILSYLQSLGRAQTLGRGRWTWKRTPEEVAEIEELRAQIFDDKPVVPGPPVHVTFHAEDEEIPEEDGEGTISRELLASAGDEEDN